MSYDSTRDAEQLRILDPSIDDFIERYNDSDIPAGARQTIFFFPGGLASTLKRATTPYIDGGPVGQMFDYETVWLTFEDFLGGALDLRIHRVGRKYRDLDDRIIVTDGTVRILGWTFYEGFVHWCETRGLDYYVFGWDWRRRLQDSGKFFYSKFLPYFQERVRDGCNDADPLSDFSLIGHSAGGMVVNWILRQSPDHSILDNLNKVITVATPFYGYASQVHRWFEGEPYLNGIGDVFKAGIIRVICSCPACYAWQFLDVPTFTNHQAEFLNDVQYPLINYPSTDEATGVPADPYHPLRNGDRRRYPSPRRTGFDHRELRSGRNLVSYLCSPLADSLAAKFFNIRGDTRNDDTVGSTTWYWVPPTDPSPIANDSSVPGDDTQPAWSARHLDLLALGQVITVKGDGVSHMDIMNSRKTLNALRDLLGV
jgi:pimeloyl-ACP methyl ester carboxylesterase